MKKQHIIILLALIGVCTGWYFGLMKPLTAERQELEQESARASAQIADFKRIFRELPSYFNSQKELTRQKNLLMSRLASKEDLLRLFAEFDAMARDHKLRLVEISPSIDELLILNRESAGDTLPQILPITLSLNGPFQDIGRFVGEVENRNFYKGLNYCHINNDADGRATADIKFTFNAILGIAGKS